MGRWWLKVSNERNTYSKSKRLNLQNNSSDLLFAFEQIMLERPFINKLVDGNERGYDILLGLQILWSPEDNTKNRKPVSHKRYYRVYYYEDFAGIMKDWENIGDLPKKLRDIFNYFVDVINSSYTPTIEKLKKSGWQHLADRTNATLEPFTSDCLEKARLVDDLIPYQLSKEDDDDDEKRSKHSSSSSSSSSMDNNVSNNCTPENSQQLPLQSSEVTTTSSSTATSEANDWILSHGYHPRSSTPPLTNS